MDHKRMTGMASVLRLTTEGRLAEAVTAI
ncbi:MAG: hypothetical protein QOF38_4998, partial [Pseudonocardiales bacterium]|nr:hypothetical protein [Pseudonocardiales bacterium]